MIAAEGAVSIEHLEDEEGKTLTHVRKAAGG